MSQISDLVVYDAFSSQRTLIGTDRKTSGQKTTIDWRENVGGIPIKAQRWFRLETTILQSGVIEVTATLGIPVMEDVATGGTPAGYVAQPQVAYTDKHVYKRFVHPRADNLISQSARMMLLNIMNNILTNVAPATTGQGPQAVDSLIFPT